MAPMRSRGLVHAVAWLFATGAAVTLSWWGVHTVMAGTAYDPPRALPITAATSATQPPPLPASTQRPAPPSPSPSRSAPEKPAQPSTSPSPSHGTSGGGSGSGSQGKPSKSAPAPDAGNVKSYQVDGGRVVFDIGTASAELVSATPNAGWQMQVWTEPTWIRATFTRNGREVSVFCTWNDHPPVVQFDDR